MIRPFVGEFLISPLPLEMSFNYCSASCAFCFANLNAPTRTADIPHMARLLAEYRTRDTLAARLLQDGYPVLVSNLVDPLAHSNDQQALPLLRTMTELGIPFSIQSRGGRRVNDLLDFIPPVVWYLSINQDDDAIRKRIEPGAPTIESRLALCEELTRRGHTVVIGLNPFVPEWWRDFPAYVQRLKDAGAYAAWIQRLHFNQRQVRRMAEKDKAAIGPDLIRRALRSEQATKIDYLKEAALVVEAAGIPTYCTNLSARTSLFSAYRKVYKKTFPIMQDWVDWCYGSITPTQPIVTFENFCSVMLPRLPQGEFYIRDYIGANNRELWKEFDVPTRGTFKQLLALVWDIPDFAHSPIGEDCFAYAGSIEGDQHDIFVDASGLPYLQFSSEGFAENDIIVESRQYFSHR